MSIPDAIPVNYSFDMNSVFKTLELLGNNGYLNEDGFVVHISSLPDNGELLAEETPGSTLLVANLVTGYGGTIYFTPTQFWFGSTSFEYYLDDGQGNVSEVVTVTIEVLEVVPLPLPIPVTDSFLGVMNNSVSLPVDANDLNVELYDPARIGIQFTELPSAVFGVIRSPEDMLSIINTGQVFSKQGGPLNPFGMENYLGYFVFVPANGWTGSISVKYQYVLDGIPLTAGAEFVQLIVNVPVALPGEACVANSCTDNRARFSKLNLDGFSFAEGGAATKEDFDRLRTAINDEYTERDAHVKITLQAFDINYDDVDVILQSDMDKLKNVLNDMVGTDPDGDIYLSGLEPWPDHENVALVGTVEFPDNSNIGITDVYDNDGMKLQMMNIANKLNQLRQDCICHGDCGANSWCSCHSHVYVCDDY
jgi:hypothetical protein